MNATEQRNQPFTPGQKITVFTISEFMASTIKRQLTVKSVLPVPVPREHYVNGPIEGFRYGTMTPERKRTAYHLDIKLGDLVFDGWQVPFKTDGEVERGGDGVFVSKMFSCNACFNLAGDRETIRQWVLERNLNLPLSDTTKGSILVIPVNAQGQRVSDEDGEILFPEMSIHHAVIDRLKEEAARKGGVA